MTRQHTGAPGEVKTETGISKERKIRKGSSCNMRQASEDFNRFGVWKREWGGTILGRDNLSKQVGSSVKSW